MSASQVMLTPRQIDALKAEALHHPHLWSSEVVLRLIATIEVLGARLSRETART